MRRTYVFDNLLIAIVRDGKNEYLSGQKSDVNLMIYR